MDKGTRGKKQLAAYLFVGETKLMLKDGLPISQDLDLVGKSIKRVRQGVSKLKVVVHSHDEEGRM